MTPDLSSVPPVAGYALALGDDALVAAQRLGEWIAASPQIEEDVALGNIALDLLGQARSLLTYAGSLLEPACSEDDLAYWRDADAFRNVHLVERTWDGPDGEPLDFGVAMARSLLLSAYQCALYERLRRSQDETLAAIAAKALKEVDYHRDHATHWVVRLGDGTGESHARMQQAVDAEWPYLEELFHPVTPHQRDLDTAGVAVDPDGLRGPVTERLAAVLHEATLTVPQAAPAPGGGRDGRHTPALAAMLEDMQSVARAHPGATW